MNNGTFVEISRYTLGRITLMQILVAVASQLLTGAFFLNELQNSTTDTF